MSQGIFINGRRPASKKAVKDAIATAPDTVYVEATSMHGGEPENYVSLLATNGQSHRIHFVGPDPFTKRNFYGTITIANGKVSVK